LEAVLFISGTLQAKPKPHTVTVAGLFAPCYQYVLRPTQEELKALIRSEPEAKVDNMRHSTGVLTSFGSGWQKARWGKQGPISGVKRRRAANLRSLPFNFVLQALPMN
jgi:hypothetical protein